MKIEEGKFYKDAGGNKVGPMKNSFGCGWYYEDSIGYFEDDGSNCGGYDPDLIEEWLDEALTFTTFSDAESDTPRTFGQLTDAEKVALLLAHHEGKRIECSYNGKNWFYIEAPTWASGNFYRIAAVPTPTRVTGTCEVGPDGKPNFDTWEEV